MKWTTEPPTKPGWYWARYDGCYPVCIQVAARAVLTDSSYSKFFVRVNHDLSQSDLDFDQYCGPIPEPEEA